VTTQAEPKAQSEDRTPNRLINETSTYLLQHAYNPVDWYAWGEEALTRAKKEDKPILLSVGYAACHWCHVMEHESFEDRDTATLMNEYFVCIKVDREERTDIDEIYMKAVQMMTGHGGWPMTVFLSPDLKPFFGGTYFPPEDRHNLPGFKRLLSAIYMAWTDQREQILESADEITKHLKSFDEVGTTLGAGEASYAVVDQAVEKLLKQFDDRWGGFGGAPKFPHSFSIDLTMRCAALSYQGKNQRSDCLRLVTTTLDRMAYGGIHDQIGGGFARYSVDRQWLIPHFEKMLYDNALLCQTYLNGFRLTGREYWGSVARGIMDFALRELRNEQGGFYSSLDADSEGEEGKFYVWTPEQIESVLGADDGRFFCETFGVSKQGNFEHGTSALHWKDSPEDTAKRLALTPTKLWSKLEPMREKLLEERAKRVRPGRDEKVLTSWNSLMISALVDGYRILQDEKYLRAAKDAAEFILKELTTGDLLLRTWGQGKAKLNGYLDDYAYFSQALLDLASVDCNPQWMQRALHFASAMSKLFWDDEQGGFFYNSKDHEELITRPRSLYDGAIPSGASVAVFVYVRLAALTENKEMRARAEELLNMYAPLMVRVPDQFSNLLCGLEFSLASAPEMILVGDGKANAEQTQSMMYALYEQFMPNKVVLLWQDGTAAPEQLENILGGRGLVDGKPAVYICQNQSCGAPITDLAKLSEQMASRVAGGGE
jgi:hypothetical protein